MRPLGPPKSLHGLFAFVESPADATPESLSDVIGLSAKTVPANPRAYA